MSLFNDCKRLVQKAGGEENWSFKLSEFQEPLACSTTSILTSSARKPVAMKSSRSEERLKDLSISRSTSDWASYAV